MKNTRLVYAIGTSIIPIAAWLPTFFSVGFGTFGGDTYYHIKYAQAIVSAGRVITNNPYFPNDPLAYPLGSHILIANLSVISGIPVIPLVSVTPVLFGIPIALTFFALASRYVNRRYAFISTLLFYGASVVPVQEFSVNSAVISNTLVYPYSSVLLGTFAFYLLFLCLTNPRGSIVLDALSGIMLGELAMTFNFLALGAVVVIIAYNAILRSRGEFMSMIAIFGVGALFSSPYWTHILVAGLPTQRSAFGTYVQLTAMQYLETLGPSITALLLIGAVILILERKHVSMHLPDRKILLLLTLAVSFVIASQMWRVGLILVNDLFVFFDIGPIALLATMVLAVVVREMEQRNQKILGTAFIALLVSAGPFLAFNSVSPTLSGPKANLEVPFYGVIDYLNAHAAGSVFASDLYSQYFVASEANVLPIAINPVISDYYVADLNSRIEAVQTITGDSVSAAVAALIQYNVSYLISTGSQLYFSITGSSYVTPVYPVQPCFRGSGTSYDFRADGVMQVFDLYPGNTTNYYLLSNPALVSNFTMSYLFNPRTSGPIEILVNNTIVQSMVGSVRGIWLTATVQIPSSLVSKVELIQILNLDPLNQWYLQTISIGSTLNCNSPVDPFSRETVFLVKKNVLHSPPTPAANFLSNERSSSSSTDLDPNLTIEPTIGRTADMSNLWSSIPAVFTIGDPQVYSQAPSLTPSKRSLRRHVDRGWGSTRLMFLSEIQDSPRCLPNGCTLRLEK